jgi:DNA-binding PadR family transcriptional regulator
MPDVKDLLKVLKIIRENQPIHTYGLAIFLGKSPIYASTTAWRWIHYLEELGILVKIRDDGTPTGRKDYKLSEKGERLYEILEEIWGSKKFGVSDIYSVRKKKAEEG